ncbi:MAG: hypothetical protein INH41_28695 [Myxococcaceae bacterium]|nr:hypothetical protein [Myxococcaceae bacterium]MCA3016381.1 hypothetical protein [Myxococcaceae bacterium]
MLTSLVAAALVAAAPSPWSALSLPPPLRRVLDAGAFGATPVGFEAITLSHLADGCAAQGEAAPHKREAARACVLAAYRRALRLHPVACRATDDAPRCDADAMLARAEPLALAHLTLVLGAGDRLGVCPDEALHHALAAGLAQLSLNDPTRLAPSYRANRQRWPADQAALLAGLARADAAHGTHHHVAPTAAFFAALAGAGTHLGGLPVSEVTGTAAGARLPRGCAQSFISRYLAEVDPARTLVWWRRYRRDFFVELPLGIVGFREWPRGVDGPSDVDSGPILLGIGTAASALAISAARANGDDALARRLEASARSVMALGVASEVAHAPFAEAIRFEARWHAVAAPEADRPRSAGAGEP